MDIYHKTEQNSRRGRACADPERIHSYQDKGLQREIDTVCGGMSGKMPPDILFPVMAEKVKGRGRRKGSNELSDVISGKLK